VFVVVPLSDPVMWLRDDLQRSSVEDHAMRRRIQKAPGPGADCDEPGTQDHSDRVQTSLAVHDCCGTICWEELARVERS